MSNLLFDVDDAAGSGTRTGDQLDPRGSHWDDRLEDGVLDSLDLLFKQPDLHLEVRVAFALFRQVMLEGIQLLLPVLTTPLRSLVVQVPHATVLDVVRARVVGRPAGARLAAPGPVKTKQWLSCKAPTFSSRAKKAIRLTRTILKRPSMPKEDTVKKTNSSQAKAGTVSRSEYLGS